MCAEPSSGCATMSYLPSLYCLRSSEGNAMPRSSGWRGLFLGGLEHARQVDLVELDRGLVGGLDRRLHAVGFPGRLLERVGELEAEGGERLGIGLLLVRARERAVNPAREQHEDALGEIDVGLLGIVSCRRLRRRVAGGGCAHDLSGLITAILRSSSLSVRASWSRSSFETMTCASGLSLCTW